QAEGIVGPSGSAACIPMTKWGLHWYFNNQSLVHKRPITKTGWPWSDPINAFAKDYSYAAGTCPTCDDLAKRSAILSISSCLEKGDADDVIAAFRKVAANIG